MKQSLKQMQVEEILCQSIKHIAWAWPIPAPGKTLGRCKQNSFLLGVSLEIHTALPSSLQSIEVRSSSDLKRLVFMNLFTYKLPPCSVPFLRNSLNFNVFDFMLLIRRKPAQTEIPDRINLYVPVKWPWWLAISFWESLCISPMFHLAFQSCTACFVSCYICHFFADVFNTHGQLKGYQMSMNWYGTALASCYVLGFRLQIKIVLFRSPSVGGFRLVACR